MQTAAHFHHGLILREQVGEHETEKFDVIGFEGVGKEKSGDRDGPHEDIERGVQCEGLPPFCGELGPAFAIFFPPDLEQDENAPSEEGHGHDPDRFMEVVEHASKGDFAGQLGHEGAAAK